VQDTSSTGIATRKSLARLLAYLKGADSGHQQQWEKLDLALRKRLGLEENTGAQPILTLDGLREQPDIFAEDIFGRTEVDKVDQPRLCDYVTLYGDGRVNLNTAPAAVLYSLDEEYSEELVGQIEAWRGNVGDPSSTRPFKNAKELETVPGIIEQADVDGQLVVVKNLFVKVQDRLSVQSKAFSVRIVAEVDGRRQMALAYFNVESLGPTSQPKLIAYEEIEP
jgi:hypothetical protein